MAFCLSDFLCNSKALKPKKVPDRSIFLHKVQEALNWFVKRLQSSSISTVLKADLAELTLNPYQMKVMLTVYYFREQLLFSQEDCDWFCLVAVNGVNKNI